MKLSEFTRRPVRRMAYGAALMAMAFPAVAGAQQVGPVSPASVTPQSLAPERRDSGYRVDIPEAGALRAPAGAETMAVTLGDVRVEGGFAEVAGAVDAITARLKGRRVSLAEIYAAASAIEAAHARAGYVLARVSVPPQDLADGATLMIRVTDGFIEKVDVSALPARARGAVLARARGLEGKRHVTMAEIEQPLMVASDVPGLTLRSTLMRGDQPGGAKLVLEGGQQLLSGSLGVDNGLDPSLGRWEVNLQLALNGALGLGEQIYGFVSSGYEVNRLFDSGARERVLGGGVILPLGDGRFSLNPEATFARTAPTPPALAPQTVGTLRRYTLRANEVLVRSRAQQASLNLAIEQVDEKNAAPDFAVTINHDRYMAARGGLSVNAMTPRGDSYGGSFQFSQGLGGLGSISAADAAAALVPFSRIGSSTSFSKLVAGLHAGWELGQGFAFSAQTRAQTSFGKPVFRAEQFALEGSDGLSAYVGGVTALDAGAVVRSELSDRLPMPSDVGAILSGIAPYVFTAFGAGRLEQPSGPERRSISAFNLGGGLRATLAGRINLGVEYARGISRTSTLNAVNRVSASATLKF